MMAGRTERLPHTLMRRLGIQHSTLTRVTTGESGAMVYRVTSPDHITWFLKYGRGAIGDEIAAETARLRWAAAHLCVPDVVSAGRSGAVTYQLATALAGESAYAAMTRDPSCASALACEIGEFLRGLHDVPVAACPFDAHHTLRMQAARHNIDMGRVDVDDFDDERAGWTAEQVWDALEALLPLHTEPAVTHGDCSLDNIMVDGGRVTGCLDVGRLGVADRYQDLAIVCNQLAEFGAAAQRALFEAYGITTPDQHRLDFHRLLDELF